ncbi:hypothetical protein JIN84_18975 [Luteolibacter yonseiensis]|uniref:Uncharacterized protein n=1 Tax=Luteolibacter yonseiensis TaxID=1144680 RepID=A0A934R922_9BACT|nr:hypothetical protein [Luteolibacter yonseiensis]MBK1817710.1 hypothetical protein [Luteolibacter yonseiensis]
MFPRNRQGWWLVMLLLSIALSMLFKIGDRTEKEPAADEKPNRSDTRAMVSDAPPRGYRSTGDFLRDVETLFGRHEAGRAHLLSRKETVDSELHLLGVEPPAPDEVRNIRQQVERLLSEVAPGNHTLAEARLAKLIQEYDPYGYEGRRVIQIDVPDEPNGRLTGFTCQAPDFTEITARFINGEMMDLQNLRGYSASYAGMPLTRFDALIVMDDQENR